MKTLHLTLKKKWFDMIKAGIKKEEYREIKPYWINRLCKPLPMSVIDGGDLVNNHSGRNYDLKKFDQISFRNGYSKNAPTMLVKLEDIKFGNPKCGWCEPGETGKEVFILKLGTIIE